MVHELGNPALLALLPVKKLKAKVTGKDEYVEFLCDGSYDGEWFESIRWDYNPSIGLVGMWYYNKGTGQKTTKRKYMHHFVLPPKKGLWVVHLNGNQLDNRSCNLGYMTPKEAIAMRDNRLGGSIYDRTIEGLNKHPTRKRGGATSSPYVGVRKNMYKTKSGNKVGGTYYVMYKGKYAGSFKNPEDAARAYDKKVYKDRGIKSILNFPESIEVDNK